MLFKAQNQSERAMREIVTGLNRIEGGINGVLGTAAKLGTAFVGLQAAAGGIGGIADRLTGFVRDASGVVEATNRISVVFGAAAASVTQFADTSATSLGLSRRAALEAVGGFGNLFTSMGFGQNEAAGMSEQLVSLASDLASFNNIAVSDALDKLRSGLVGEAEPLRTLGVNLNQAAVEAKALELGLIAQGQPLSAAARAQATYALILEQTTNAQGDFARTSGDLANASRILEAQLTDLGTSVGEAFRPLAGDVVRILNDFFQTLDQGGAIDAFRAGLDQRAEAVRSFISTVQGLMTGEGLGALDATLTAVAGTIRTQLGEEAASAFETLSGAVGSLSSRLGVLVTETLLPAASAIGTLAVNLVGAATSGDSFVRAIGPAGGILDGMRTALETLNPLLTTHAELLLGAAAGYAAFSVLRTVVPAVVALGAAFTGLQEAVAARGVAAGIGALATALGGPVTIAIVGVSAALATLTAAWIGDWANIQTQTEATILVIGSKLDELGSKLDGLRTPLEGTGLGQAFETLGTTVNKVLTAMGVDVDGLGDKLTAFVDLALRTLPLVGPAFGAVADNLAQVRREIDETALGLRNARDEANKAAAAAKAQADAEREAQRAAQAAADEEARQLALAQRQAEDLARLQALLDQQDAAYAESLARRLAEYEAYQQALRDKQAQAQGRAGGGGGAAGGRGQVTTQEATTAIQGFMAELARDTVRWERMFGEMGARAAQGLVDAIESNTEAAGTGVARALQELVRAAERAGVPAFQELADEVAGSFHDALIDRGNPMLRAAALENLRAFLAAIRQASALTAENFARAFDIAAAAEGLGQGGRQVMEALRRAIEEGGAQNVQALAQAAVGMRRALFEQFEDPGRAAEIWAGVWNAINTAIEDGSQEALTTLRDFLSDLDFAVQAEKLGTAMGDRINVAIENTATAITEAADRAAQQIEEARNRIIEARDLRAARENVTRVQAEELRGVEESIRIARENWQRMREEQEIGRRRAHEDAERAISDARELEDLERRRAQQLAETRRQHQPGGTPVGGLGTQVERRGGVDELRARFRQEDEERVRQQARQDADRDRRRGQEDADLQRRRREAEVDRREAETQALLLRQFRETQARTLQTFLDLQEDQGLARQVNRITVEAQKSIDEANRRLGEVRTKEQAEYEAQMARLNALRTNANTVWDGYLADLDLASRMRGAEPPKPTPGQLETELPQLNRQTAPVGAGAEDSGRGAPQVTINIAGHVVGVDDFLALINRGLGREIESVTAVGGY